MTYPPIITLQEAQDIYIRHGWNDIYTFDEFVERMQERGTAIVADGGVPVVPESERTKLADK